MKLTSRDLLRELPEKYHVVRLKKSFVLKHIVHITRDTFSSWQKELVDKNVKYVVDINVIKNGIIVPINNTKMKIKVALPENLKGYKKYEVVYILDNEIKETIPATIENGYVVFETSHLSEYGIIATENINNINNPKTGDNIVIYIIEGFLSAIVIIGLYVIYNYRNKHIN